MNINRKGKPSSFSSQHCETEMTDVKVVVFVGASTSDYAIGTILYLYKSYILEAFDIKIAKT